MGDFPVPPTLNSAAASVCCPILSVSGWVGKNGSDLENKCSNLILFGFIVSDNDILPIVSF